MHRELVEGRRWVSERRFLRALNYCLILPGPEAQQRATYVGWLMFGTISVLAWVAVFRLKAGALRVLGAAPALGTVIALACMT